MEPGEQDACIKAGAGPKPPSLCGWAIGTVGGVGWIFNTEDGGVTWDRQDVPTELEGVPLESVSAVDNLHAWIVGTPNPKEGETYGTILYTETGGSEWLRQGSAKDVPLVEFNKVRALDQQTAWVVGASAAVPGDKRPPLGTILVTRDGGSTWTMQTSNNIPPVNLQGLAVVDSEVIWVSGFNNQGYGTILRTTDGGKIWERLGRPQDLPSQYYIGMSALSKEVAWAVGNGYTIRHTCTSGETWSEESPFAGALQDANEIQVIPNGEGWVGWTVMDYANIYRSLSGSESESWSQQQNPAKGYFLRDISAVDAQTAWVVGNSGQEGEKGKVLFTATGGQDWYCQQYKNSYEFPAGLLSVSFVK